jgi:hypothetical protein
MHQLQSPTKLTVPYRAKGNPAPKSEFSHPDVVIILTALSCYHMGLSNQDLLLALKHLVNSEQTNAEHQEWINNAPDWFHDCRCRRCDLPCQQSFLFLLNEHFKVLQLYVSPSQTCF